MLPYFVSLLHDANHDHHALRFLLRCKSTAKVTLWVQAIPEQAAGTACGAPEPAVQLLCLHPDF